MNPRLLPEGFLQTYVEVLGETPPEELLEAYELLCEAVYFGIEAREEVEGGIGRSRHAESYDFRDHGLFYLKAKVDKILASYTRGLRTWSATRTRSGSNPQGHARHRGADLPRPRGSQRPPERHDGSQPTEAMR